MTQERTGATQKWRGIGLGLYGVVLAGLGVLAGLVRSDGSSPLAPPVVVAYVQLATVAVTVPFWVGQRVSAGLFGAFLRMFALMVVGLAGMLVAVTGGKAGGWGQAFMLQGLIACFAVTAAGVTVLAAAILRKGLAAQFTATLILFVLLAGPMLANPIIMWAGPANRTAAIDCVSYASPLVVSAYAADVDFYRGQRMYVWSVAGDYAFRVPRPFRAGVIYLCVGSALIAGFRPLRPRLTKR